MRLTAGILAFATLAEGVSPTWQDYPARTIRVTPIKAR